jgi:drug/metabolite transporter (DMT)-like permease
MAEQNNRIGTLMFCMAMFIFAAQDGISRHLGSHYNVFSIVMLRYWVFAAFGVWLLLRAHGSIRPAFATPHPVRQAIRGLLLAVQICIMQLAFVTLGLIESHAVFVTAPLIVAALSGPLLGEKVGWRRWTAIGVGCVGVLVVLKPGAGVFSLWSLVPLLGAFLYALYGLLTRYVGRADSSAISFFWMGMMGALAMTVPGLWLWQPMTPVDSFWMATLCCTGIIGHWLLIRSYEITEASAVQPFAYLQLVFIAFFGITIFGEALRWNVALGALIVVAAGLFTFWRQQIRARAELSRPTIPT